MTITIVILTMLLVVVVVWIVSGPLRALGAREREEGSGGATLRTPAPRAQDERHELETAREAKYREIRDAELDFRTGKLSREDFEAIDAQLRGEALALLDRIERLQAGDRTRTEEPQDSGSQPRRD